MAALEISSPGAASATQNHQQQHSPPGSASSAPNKRKRRPAGTPDPDAEVVSLSPKTLMESDRYVCEICNQGFQRDQNLQMHRRRHKVPWKLLKRATPEVKKRVYVCPEPSCLHHDPCHALGDLVGIKKHFRRKHSTEKQWKCDKCSKGYAVQSDYKAHLKTCGTRGHCCACGRVFSRVESFIEHQDTCSVAKEKASSFCDSDSPSSFHFLNLGEAQAQQNRVNGRPAAAVNSSSPAATAAGGVSGLTVHILDESNMKSCEEFSKWSMEQRELQLMPIGNNNNNNGKNNRRYEAGDSRGLMSLGGAGSSMTSLSSRCTTTSQHQVTTTTRSTGTQLNSPQSGRMMMKSSPSRSSIMVSSAGSLNSEDAGASLKLQLSIGSSSYEVLDEEERFKAKWENEAGYVGTDLRLSSPFSQDSSHRDKAAAAQRRHSPRSAASQIVQLPSIVEQEQQEQARTSKNIVVSNEKISMRIQQQQQQQQHGFYHQGMFQNDFHHHKSRLDSRTGGGPGAALEMQLWPAAILVGQQRKARAQVSYCNSGGFSRGEEDSWKGSLQLQEHQQQHQHQQRNLSLKLEQLKQEARTQLRLSSNERGNCVVDHFQEDGTGATGPTGGAGSGHDGTAPHHLLFASARRFQDAQQAQVDYNAPAAAAVLLAPKQQQVLSSFPYNTNMNNMMMMSSQQQQVRGGGGGGIMANSQSESYAISITDNNRPAYSQSGCTTSSGGDGQVESSSNLVEASAGEE